MQRGQSERNAFVSALHAELTAFEALQQTLETEQACLLEADVEALLRLTEVKTRQIETLTGLANTRASYLDALNLDAGRAGMAQWLLVHAGTEAPRLAALWDRVLEGAAQARALNDANGSLIAGRLSHNQGALAALQSAARGLSTYGRDGQPERATGQRELGSA